MNIILVEPDEIQEDSVLLTDDRAKHVVKVLRSELQDTVRVGMINGKMGFGTITAINRKFPFTVALTLELNQLPPPTPLLDLILALPRPIMLRRILSQVVALGVGGIYLINANRVEKSFWQAGLLDEHEYRPHLLHGLEQAIDTKVPGVVIHKKFKPFIEDYLPPLLSGYSTQICAHPDGESQLSEISELKNGRTLLAIGPEGGWVDYEVEKFKELQFDCCSMGERILKVDTAVVALHSRITALREILRRGEVNSSSDKC